jgi:hypothetical protein
MKQFGALLALTLGLTSLGVVTATPALAAPPTNDALAAAEVIAGPGTLAADTTDATLETDEADAAHIDCDSIDASLWYAYTAPSSDVLRLDTAGPGIDSVISVYTSDDPGAPTIDSLTPVRCNDEVGDGHLSNVQFKMTAGTVYFIQLASYQGSDPGPVQLTVTQGPAPGNDDRTGADVIDALSPGTPVHPTTELATRQTGEPSACGAVNSSVWYRWRPDATVIADLETTDLGPEMSTAVNVYRGALLSNPVCGGLDVQFTTQPATTYYIQVADAGTQLKHGRPGTRELLLTTGPAPANDTVAGATTVTSPSTNPVTNAFAGTASEGQPTSGPCNNGFPVTRTVWYRYSPESSGDLVLETLDPQQSDTKLAVYTGPATGAAYPDLTPVGCDDDGGSGPLSRLQLPVTADTTYYLQVGTIGAKGSFDLHLASGTATDLDATATGQTVDLDATVGAISGTPTGTVEFFDGDQSKGTAPLTGGLAHLTLGSVSGGSHTYRAEFVPADTDYLASTSTTRSVTVTVPTPPPPPVADRTTTTLIAPPKVSTGRRATVRVLVTTTTGATATGTVTITIGKRTKTVALVNGRATLRSSRLRKPGKVAVVASYAATSSTLASSATAKIKVRNRHRTNA